MIIIFLGPPGAGKGTQCKLLADHYHFQHISSGDCLRREIKNGTEWGKQAQALVEIGQLVSDELVMKLITREIENTDHDGVVLDGFPRTVAQARQLDEFLQHSEKKINAVFNLDVADQKLADRITGRRSCPQCGAVYHITFNPPQNEGLCNIDDQTLVQRPDDTPEIVLHRIKTYKEMTAPLVDYYSRKGLVNILNGDTDIEQLTAAMFQVIDGLQAVNDNVRS